MEYSKLSPKFIWVGKFGWLSEGSLVSEMKQLETSGVLEFKNNVNDYDLEKLLLGARALLFPSLVEGWGLPMTEALAMGVPVIASDIAIFREIGQGIPDLINPYDTHKWKHAISEYIELESCRRRAQIQRLQSYEPNSWNSHFKLLYQILNAKTTNSCSMLQN